MIDISNIKEITNDFRKAHFLSQCDHESMGFRIKEENLNYSASRLVQVFPKYFKSITDALPYDRNKELIANKIYSNRIGNIEKGDGYKFRGRGFIQLTGRTNYKMFSMYINENCVSNPDLVKDKYPLESASWFFTINNLWAICDKGSDIETIRLLTKRINGGYNGIEDRIKLFNKYYL